MFCANCSVEFDKGKILYPLIQGLTPIIDVEKKRTKEILLNRYYADVERSNERLADRGVIQLPPLADVKNHRGQKVSEYWVGKHDSYVIVKVAGLVATCNQKAEMAGSNLFIDTKKQKPHNQTVLQQ